MVGYPLLALVPVEFKIRFWNKVDTSGDGCWGWRAAANNKGYGVVFVNGKREGAHRVAFELANGRPPVSQVMHACDNPACCRPAHLREGTQSDNIQDMLRKGRNKPPRGERCGRAKLTHEQAREIRDSDTPLRELAQRFGISHEQARRIRRGMRWPEVQNARKTQDPDGAATT